MDESEVPDHSKRPASRETPKVISVSTGLMPMFRRKEMKLAECVSCDCPYTQGTKILTICGGIHHNEARINFGGFTSILEVYSIGVTPQTLICFVEMDLMISALQCPQSGKTRAAASHHRDFLSALHFRNKWKIENGRSKFENLN